MPQDFASSTEIGGFANAVTSEPPAQDKPVIETAKPETVVEKPVVQETKPAVEKPADEPLQNPNLSPKKLEAKVEDEDAIPAGMPKPAQETWKKIKASEKQARAERDEAAKERDAIRAELAESGKTKTERDALKKELDDAKACIAEYDQDISVHRVEMSEAWKKEITTPLKEMNDSVTELATRYEIAPETILRAIQEPDRAKRVDMIDEVTVDFKGLDKREVEDAGIAYHKIQKQAAEKRANAAKTLEEITRQQKEASDKVSTKTAADYQTAVKNHWETFRAKVPEIRKVDGNEPWNAHLDGLQRADEARDVNDIPVEEVADWRVKASAMPEILNVLNYFKKQDEAQKAKIADLENRIKGIRGATPGAGTGGNGHSDGAKKDSRLFSEVVFSKE